MMIEYIDDDIDDNELIPYEKYRWMCLVGGIG